MPLPAAFAAHLAFKGASILAKKVRQKMGQKGKAPRGAGSTRRRPRRIVFSENQWEFVRALIRSTTGRGMPAMPRGRRRRRRTPFGG